MSILDGVEPGLRNEIQDWLHDMYVELESKFGAEAEVYIFNAFEETRIRKENSDKFTRHTLINHRAGNKAVASYKNAILEGELLHLLEANNPKISQDGVCYRSFQHLVYSGFIENSLEEPPPKTVRIRRPLGTGTWHLWVTFEPGIDPRKPDANRLRDLLGLQITTGDFLYGFPVNLVRPKYIPSIFDAFGRPPFRPVTSATEWGLTRNLRDDSAGLPEILILPFKTLEESPIGWRVDPKIGSPPPKGWVKKRLEDATHNEEYQRWRKLWLR